MLVADDAIRELLANEVVRPKVIERALDLVMEELRPDRQAAEIETRRSSDERRLADVRVRLANLTEVAAQGGAVPSVLEGLQVADRDRREIEGRLAALDRQVPRPFAFNPRQMRADVRAYVRQWQSLTADNVREDARAAGDGAPRPNHVPAVRRGIDADVRADGPAAI